MAGVAASRLAFSPSSGWADPEASVGRISESFEDEDLMGSLLASIEEWTGPLEGVSRGIGGALSGRNPFDTENNPLTAEALIELGVPPALAWAAEFALVPDPTGVSRAADLIPAMAMALPFLGRLRRTNPPLANFIEGIATTNRMTDVARQVPAAQATRAFMGAARDIASDPSLTAATGVRWEMSGYGSSLKVTTAEGASMSIYPQIQRINGRDQSVMHIGLLQNYGQHGVGGDDILAVLELADSTGVIITTYPAGLSPDRMETIELQGMYNRLGFERLGGIGDDWIRYPVAGLADQAARDAAFSSRLITQVQADARQLRKDRAAAASRSGGGGHAESSEPGDFGSRHDRVWGAVRAVGWALPLRGACQPVRPRSRRSRLSRHSS
jgi:hypothetical protein